jgi:transposase
LLKADANTERWTDEKIAEAFEVSTATVARERQRYCEEGLEVALMPRKPGRPRRRVLEECSMAGPRRTWSLWLAPIHPKGESVGV